MNKLATGLLLGGLVFGGITLANAGSGFSENCEHHGMHGMAGKHGNKGQYGFAARIERMAKRLNLTEQQLKKVQEVEATYQPKMQAMYDKGKSTHQKLREAMHGDLTDQAAIKKLAQQVGELKADKIVLHSQMRAEINKILTKEQQQQMKTMHEKYKHHGDNA